MKKHYMDVSYNKWFATVWWTNTTRALVVTMIIQHKIGSFNIASIFIALTVSCSSHFQSSSTLLFQQDTVRQYLIYSPSNWWPEATVIKAHYICNQLVILSINWVVDFFGIACYCNLASLRVVCRNTYTLKVYNFAHKNVLEQLFKAIVVTSGYQLVLAGKLWNSWGVAAFWLPIAKIKIPPFAYSKPNINYG